MAPLSGTGASAAQVPGTSLEVADDGRTLALGSTTGALWMSRDAGDSWTALSRGLPPAYCVRFA